MLALIACLVVQAVVTVLGQQTWMTDWDHHFTFSCPSNQALKTIASIHSNKREDRVFNFGCAEIKSSEVSLGSCEWSGYINEWDRPLDYRCPDGGIIVGIESYHRNKQEDRRFKLKCCKTEGWVPHGCTYTGYVNDWDKPFNYRVPDGMVMTGVYSYHINKREDRLFKFDVCRLSKVSETWSPAVGK